MSALAHAQAATRSSSDVARSVRADILSGARKPGERVPLDGLKAALGVSLSPIREGLSQLVAEGLLIPAGQRGYRVAPVSVAEYQDIMGRRIDLECMALAASIARGGEDWEVALVAAFQRLMNFESKRWLADELGAWEQRHAAFHQTLISACGSPILLGFCAQLHDMADRYRRVLMSTHEPDRDVSVEHQAMYQAALAHDAPRACAVLREHIERTGQTVLRMMGERTAS
ncbi:FCD domain-containing protein [Ottowia pentelensis]|uniref:FCD domain-containing protein n=2 Tax=Comamonadaceae TaxID=80864 RepID=A0ABV6PRB1_9BURK